MWWRPGLGDTQLSRPGTYEMAWRVPTPLADGQDSPERGLRTPGSPTNGVAET